MHCAGVDMLIHSVIVRYADSFESAQSSSRRNFSVRAQDSTDHLGGQRRHNICLNDSQRPPMLFNSLLIGGTHATNMGGSGSVSAAPILHSFGNCWLVLIMHGGLKVHPRITDRCPAPT